MEKIQMVMKRLKRKMEPIKMELRMFKTSVSKVSLKVIKICRERT